MRRERGQRRSLFSRASWLVGAAVVLSCGTTPEEGVGPALGPPGIVFSISPGRTQNSLDLAVDSASATFVASCTPFLAAEGLRCPEFPTGPTAFPRNVLTELFRTTYSGRFERSRARYDVVPYGKVLLITRGGSTRRFYWGRAELDPPVQAFVDALLASVGVSHLPVR